MGNSEKENCDKDIGCGYTYLGTLCLIGVLVTGVVASHWGNGTRLESLFYVK